MAKNPKLIINVKYTIIEQYTEILDLHSGA